MDTETASPHKIMIAEWNSEHQDKKSYLVAVENDISNRTFVLIANKRRVKILEMLRGFRGDSVIPENVGNIKQVQALINELNFDKLYFRRINTNLASASVPASYCHTQVSQIRPAELLFYALHVHYFYTIMSASVPASHCHTQVS